VYSIISLSLKSLLQQIGPASSRPPTEDSETFVGSRSAELRAAKLAAQRQQPFGAAPAGYIPGAGRGASAALGDDDGPSGGAGMESSLFINNEQDDEDDEADAIYRAIDERMNSKRKRNDNDAESSTIGHQFRELKQQLANVTEDQWAAIPDVGDYSLRHKQKRREDVFTPLTDSLLESRAALSSETKIGTTPVSSNDGYRTNLSGLAEARSTVMTMSLDKMSDSISGQTVVDPKGYLTSLSSVKIATAAEVGDVNKARLLLKSVRDTNPKHAPGWIAAARVEEAAGKLVQARKLIVEGCETCPENEDVWLEAARLHPVDQAKTILAAGSRRMPHSVKIFLRAAELEGKEEDKRAVLRRALEVNPNSVMLWKAAIDLEEEGDARILLGVAVEKVPHSVGE
jgi:pre-mRNA-processing factor 6